MQMLARTPAAAYRRVALEARIEASDSAALTRLCLEEALAALGQSLVALDCGRPLPRAALARAQAIMVWLAHSVAPDHPLGDSLRQFYGGLAIRIGTGLQHADRAAISDTTNDIKDLLAAAA
jgi:hypothetical protein